MAGDRLGQLFVVENRPGGGCGELQEMAAGKPQGVPLGIMRGAGRCTAASSGTVAELQRTVPGHCDRSHVPPH
jgi:tripartite-type tricarboxylate transporter receptor subunit TctC